ncbi:hypothetical protein [Pseudarthrobacter sp. efr-133-R2A-89]|uniref:hypothetical protein n=1 Tax=Pseudarthrobacter sp. efr-133-R2A-89 TaxID=3040302 RepID=UPI002555DE67|nr:hypothetical protein [Pseudarthrobacter sp. efr-133-R2A-89]
MTLDMSHWRSLSRGEEIEVFDDALVIALGVVDDFTHDRRILWLHLTYGGGRRMFHHEDGWHVRAARREQ